jgi:hypothetical protein
MNQRIANIISSFHLNLLLHFHFHYSSSFVLSFYLTSTAFNLTLGAMQGTGGDRASIWTNFIAIGSNLNQFQGRGRGEGRGEGSSRWRQRGPPPMAATECSSSNGGGSVVLLRRRRRRGPPPTSPTPTAAAACMGQVVGAGGGGWWRTVEDGVAGQWSSRRRSRWRLGFVVDELGMGREKASLACG